MILIPSSNQILWIFDKKIIENLEEKNKWCIGKAFLNEINTFKKILYGYKKY